MPALRAARRRRSRASARREPVAEALHRQGMVGEEILARAADVAADTGQPLARTLVDMGVISHAQLFQAYAEITGLPVWDEQGRVLDGDEAPFPADFLIYNNILPIEWETQLCFVIADPEDDGLIALLRALHPQAKLALHPEEELAFRLEQHFEAQRSETGDELIGTTDDDVEQLKDLALEAPIIRQVNDLVTAGLRMGASDIHLEPYRAKVAMRYRVDGVLHTRPAPSSEDYPAVVSRLKILSELDIAERRLPQDGRFKIKNGGRDVDVRVSTIPSTFGEDVVLRLLDQKKQLLSLEASGLEIEVARRLRDTLRRSHGLVLVTGPTGSGKTTTLYSGLRDIIDGEKKIVTVEDPVEYEIPGITQVQVHADIGLTFAATLRSMLRHDPDVILVGEIRDGETAEIAVQAALTGHLVLSTVHTNDAVSAVGRMLNMGVPDYLLANSLLAVTGQRLVRRLCPECRRPAPADDKERRRLDLPADTVLYEARGCEVCSQTGYRGRLPITEFLGVDGHVREAILKTPTNDAILAAGRENGYRTMLEDGLDRARAAEIPLHEILRVVG